MIQKYEEIERKKKKTDKTNRTIRFGKVVPAKLNFVSLSTSSVHQTPLRVQM